jgi:hypothetical protein
MLRSALDVPPQRIPLRRPSLSLDGTPFVYSLKLSPSPAPPGFRMLVEPGGVGITVAEQIDYTLLSLDALARRLGWTRLGEDLNPWFRRLLPGDASAVRSDWGGLWLGLSVDGPDPELRAYVNLRRGDARARWARFADAMAVFATQELEAPFLALVRRLAPLAIPVGVAAAIRRGRVAGLRLYAALFHPRADDACAALGLEASAAADEVRALFAAYSADLGPLPPQGATLALDFRVRDGGGVDEDLARVKVDLCCALLPDEVQATRTTPWLLSRHAAVGIDPAPLAAFLDDLRDCFGGHEIDYVSLGFRRGAPEITTYARARGHALA